jgi:hypothetical protein
LEGGQPKERKTQVQRMKLCLLLSILKTKGSLRFLRDPFAGG